MGAHQVRVPELSKFLLVLVALVTLIVPGARAMVVSEEELIRKMISYQEKAELYQRRADDIGRQLDLMHGGTGQAADRNPLRGAAQRLLAPRGPRADVAQGHDRVHIAYEAWSRTQARLGEDHGNSDQRESGVQNAFYHGFSAGTKASCNQDEKCLQALSRHLSSESKPSNCTEEAKLRAQAEEVVGTDATKTSARDPPPQPQCMGNSSDYMRWCYYGRSAEPVLHSPYGTSLTKSAYEGLTNPKAQKCTASGGRWLDGGGVMFNYYFYQYCTIAKQYRADDPTGMCDMSTTPPSVRKSLVVNKDEGVCLPNFNVNKFPRGTAKKTDWQPTAKFNTWSDDLALHGIPFMGRQNCVGGTCKLNATSPDVKALADAAKNTPVPVNAAALKYDTTYRHLWVRTWAMVPVGRGACFNQADGTCRPGCNDGIQRPVLNSAAILGTFNGFFHLSSRAMYWVQWVMCSMTPPTGCDWKAVKWAVANQANAAVLKASLPKCPATCANYQCEKPGADEGDVAESYSDLGSSATWGSVTNAVSSAASSAASAANSAASSATAAANSAASAASSGLVGQIVSLVNSAVDSLPELLKHFKPYLKKVVIPVLFKTSAPDVNGAIAAVSKDLGKSRQSKFLQAVRKTVPELLMNFVYKQGVKASKKGGKERWIRKHAASKGYGASRMAVNPFYTPALGMQQHCDWIASALPVAYWKNACVLKKNLKSEQKHLAQSVEKCGVTRKDIQELRGAVALMGTMYSGHTVIPNQGVWQRPLNGKVVAYLVRAPNNYINSYMEHWVNCAHYIMSQASAGLSKDEVQSKIRWVCYGLHRAGCDDPANCEPCVDHVGTKGTLGGSWIRTVKNPHTPVQESWKNFIVTWKRVPPSEANGYKGMWTPLLNGKDTGWTKEFPRPASGIRRWLQRRLAPPECDFGRPCPVENPYNRASSDGGKTPVKPLKTHSCEDHYQDWKGSYKGCLTQLKLEINRCTTCCCAGGLTSSSVEHRLIFGNQVDCGLFFAVMDTSMRSLITLMRSGFLMAFYRQPCFTAE